MEKKEYDMQKDMQKYAKKVKYLKIGFHLWILFVLVVFSSKFILSVTPYMKERELFLRKEYNMIQYPAGTKTTYYRLFDKGVIRRRVYGEHKYPLIFPEALEYNKKELERLGWEIFCYGNSDLKFQFQYYFYKKKNLELHLYHYGDVHIPEGSMWSIEIRYQNDYF